MEWSKIKTILILILLCVNAFLIGLYFTAGFDERASELQIAEDVYGVIRRSGIEINKSIIPYDSKNIQFYRATRDIQLEKNVAITLVGEYNPKIIEFKSGGSITANYPNPNPQTKHSDIAKCFNVELTPLKTGNTAPNAQKYIQTVNLLPVLNCTVNISISNDFVQINGNLILAKVEEVTGRKALNISDLLLSFVDKIKDEKRKDKVISTITPALISQTVATGDIVFVPVWQVITDQESYLFNAQTGQIIIQNEST